MYEDFLLEKKRHGLEQKISALEKRMLSEGMPFQKIIGFINFDNLKIKVNRNVLIPRYETQEVVEHALKYIKPNSSVLDLGCGSGYIGLTIKQKTKAKVVLSDVSKEAILQTQENAKLNNLDVEIITSNLFEKIHQTFDVIVSNPPYIPSKTQLSNSVTNFEPHEALFGKEDGNHFYRLILKDVKNYLKKGGYLIFEISPDNKKFMIKNQFKVLKDINGKERIAVKKY